MSGPFFPDGAYRISRPRISQGTERQSHPNRDDVLIRHRERPPESDPLPDHIRPDAHFSKYIVRYPKRVIPGIIIGQSVPLCLGLTHCQSNALGIGVVAIKGNVGRRFIKFRTLAIFAAHRLWGGKIAFESHLVHPCRFLSPFFWRGLSHIHHLVIENFGYRRVISHLERCATCELGEEGLCQADKV